MTNKSKPPKILEKILTKVIRDRDKENLPGDFEEEFIETAEEKGRYKAIITYIYLLLRLIPSFLNFSLNSPSRNKSSKGDCKALA